MSPVGSVQTDAAGRTEKGRRLKWPACEKGSVEAIRGKCVFLPTGAQSWKEKSNRRRIFVHVHVCVFECVCSRVCVCAVFLLFFFIPDHHLKSLD